MKPLKDYIRTLPKDERDAIAQGTAAKLKALHQQPAPASVQLDVNHWSYLPDNVEDLMELPDGEEPSSENYPSDL